MRRCGEGKTRERVQVLLAIAHQSNSDRVSGQFLLELQPPGKPADQRVIEVNGDS